jgi:hypothetical protein
MHQHNLVQENVRFWGLRLYCDITQRKVQERRSNIHRGGSQKWPTFLMNWSKFTFTVEVSTNLTSEACYAIIKEAISGTLYDRELS